MTFESILNDAATPLALRHGGELLYSGSVNDWHATRDASGKSASVTGSVRGHGAQGYEVEVEFELDDAGHPSKVGYFSCTCPSSSGRSTMCRHGVAVALAYLAREYRDMNGSAPKASAAPAAQPAASPAAVRGAVPSPTAARAAHPTPMALRGTTAGAASAGAAAGSARTARAAGAGTSPTSSSTAAAATPRTATRPETTGLRAGAGTSRMAQVAGSTAASPLTSGSGSSSTSSPISGSSSSSTSAKTVTRAAVAAQPSPSGSTSTSTGASPSTSAAETSASAPAGTASAASPAAQERALVTPQTRDLLSRFSRESAQGAARPGSLDAGSSLTIREPSTDQKVARIIQTYGNAGLELYETLPKHMRPGGETVRPVEPVEVFPVLVSRGGGDEGPDGRAWGLKLRLSSAGAEFAIRNIEDLVRAWGSQATVSYSRELVFTHTREAFTDRANTVLEVVSHILRAQNAVRISTASAPGPAFASGKKLLFVSDGDAADLLDAMVGSYVGYQARQTSPTLKEKIRKIPVREGDPAFLVRVEPGERGGYDMTLPDPADCVLTADRMYMLLEDGAWKCGDAYAACLGPCCRALLPAPHPFHIQAKDAPSLCGTLLPAIKRFVDVRLPEDLAVEEPKPASIAFRIGFSKNGVSCIATASYGAFSTGLGDAVVAGQPIRDLARERAAKRLVETYFPHGTATRYFEADDLEALDRLLSEGLRALAEVGEVQVSEDIRHITIRQSPRLNVKATVRGSLIDLELASGDLSPRDLATYLASFERHDRFVRLSDGDVLRVEGEGAQALLDLAASAGIGLKSLTASLTKGHLTLPKTHALFLKSLLDGAEGVDLETSGEFDQVIEAFDRLGDASFPVPSSLVAVLRPYQKEGFTWLRTLAGLGFGGILADEMGLGKTLQVIAFLLSCDEEGVDAPSLIVCPASLVYNWKSEIEKFAPRLHVVTAAGNQEERRAVIDKVGPRDIVVTSYELLKRDIELYKGMKFHCQVLDEAQYIKNHTTQAARCAKAVDSEIRFALTGTPVENRLGELWSIFDYLMPSMLKGYDTFRRTFEAPIAAGDEEALEKLRTIVKPFILRRMKSDVLTDLPEKCENVVYALMEGEQERLYRATATRLAMSIARKLPEDFASQRIAVLAELTRLRQICCDPRLVYKNYEGPSAKLETCAELVSNAIDGGHKVLLFSQFTSMLQLISDRMGEMGVAHHTLTGSTSKEDRASLVSSFQNDDVPLFLISLKAGGVGLNLTAADIVIHYDPWWNLAVQNQATDRAHRIGQTKDVTVMRVIAKNTIEEKIVALQESKRALADNVIGLDAASSNLTREDILALLEP